MYGINMLSAIWGLKHRTSYKIVWQLPYCAYHAEGAYACASMWVAWFVNSVDSNGAIDSFNSLFSNTALAVPYYNLELNLRWAL